jgi:Protein of unknown function (DUF3224)
VTHTSGRRTMTTHAEGTLTINSWDENPLLEIDEKRKLTTTSVTQALHGDIEGEGTATWLSMYLSDGTAVYMGFQRIVGSIGDAEGSVVLRVTGGYDGTVARSEWTVVDGTGTGALERLAGSGASDATSDEPPRYTLEYELVPRQVTFGG